MAKQSTPQATPVAMHIDSRPVGAGHPAYLIAEIGINHQGDADIACQLIDAAADAGADAVKFQKRNVERILTREGMEMPYDNPNSFGPTYGEHKRALELSGGDYRRIRDHAMKRGVHFLASAWDEDSVDFLAELGVPCFKTASADLTNIPLLRHTATQGLPMLLSTGMGTLDDVRRAVEVFRSENAAFCVLQCTSTYPARFEEIDLRVLETYRREFPDAVIGYSGHELGIAVSVAAVALGASVVERHFTLDRTMRGNDHAASLEPQGFAKMARDIRNIEVALGVSEKRVHESEIPVRRKLAKSLVTTRAVAAGEVITREHLTTKGPGTGIPPHRMDEIIGSQANRDIDADVVLHEVDFR